MGNSNRKSNINNNNNRQAKGDSNSNSSSISTTLPSNIRHLTVEAYINQLIRTDDNDNNDNRLSVIGLRDTPIDIYVVVEEYYGIAMYQVMAVGRNSFGRFGLGDGGAETLNQSTPLPQLSQLIVDPSDIHVGCQRVLVRDADNHLHVAGINMYGECGVQSQEYGVTSFTPIHCDPSDATNTIDDIKIVSSGAGSELTLIATEENEMYSFGCNIRGESYIGTKMNHLENPTKTAQEIPQSVMESFGGRTIKQIGVGSQHTLFLMTDGTVFGCGGNQASQLGIPSSRLTESLTPIHIPFPSASAVSIHRIAVGAGHNLCVDDVNGNIYGFGRNMFSPLGFGMAFKQTRAIEHPTLHPFFNSNNNNKRTKYLQIECAFHCSGVIDADGNLFLFGENMKGQIGNGDSGQSVPDPFQISLDNKKWKQFSLGVAHTLILTGDPANEVYACGYKGDKTLLSFPFRGSGIRNRNYLSPVLCSRESMGIAGNEYGRVVRVIALDYGSLIVVEKENQNIHTIK